MASGKFGSLDLAANVDNLLVDAVPAGVVRTCSVRLCNRGPTTAKVRIAIGTGAAPVNKDYYDHGASIAAGGVLDETGMVLSEGEKLWVYTDTATVSARAHGFEGVA